MDGGKEGFRRGIRGTDLTYFLSIGKLVSRKEGAAVWEMAVRER